MCKAMEDMREEVVKLKKTEPPSLRIQKGRPSGWPFSFPRTFSG